MRPAAKRRQEPLQRLTRLRTAEELPGLELVRREPVPGPKRSDQPDRLTDAQVDTRVRDHRRGRIEQVGAGEPGLVTGDLHDGAGHRIHRRQPALKRQPHAESLTMATMLARPPRSDHRFAVRTRHAGAVGSAGRWSATPSCSVPAGRGPTTRRAEPDDRGTACRPGVGLPRRCHQGDRTPAAVPTVIPVAAATIVTVSIG